MKAQGATIATKLLPRNSTEPNSLLIKFKDGKEMYLKCEELGIKSLVEEVDRHSRMLQKAEDLEG